MNHGRCTAVVGLQWGDEGKGKVVDLIAPAYDAVVRFNGGANAGHSVVVKGERYALHLMPSGILYPGKLAVIGNGVVVDPEVVLKEISGLNTRGVDTSGLVISDRAHVVMPYHKQEDELREATLTVMSATIGEAGAGDGGGGGAGVKSIGTTKRGIGPCYADKAQRASAVRMGDLLRPAVLRRKIEIACALKGPMLRGLGAQANPDAAGLTEWARRMGEQLRDAIKDTTYLLHDLRAQGKRVLFEGANATLLDVDHGTYPYVTSSSTTALGIPSGTGTPCSAISEIIGVVKAYSTRVGNGPLLTELLDETGDRIRDRGREYGTTTGRPRRVGWLDLVAVKYSVMLSGVTSLAVTLLDVLSGFDELKVATGYRFNGVVTDRFIPDGEVLSAAEPVYTTVPGFSADLTTARSMDELPVEARRYLDLIESFTGAEVGLVGVGPDREQTIRCA
ncbi:MAG: adenylosuccinate synthase [Phycisphaerales bacterium]|nr:adenylosuccinate synthase [Phycisphaerales bacterium]